MPIQMAALFPRFQLRLVPSSYYYELVVAPQKYARDIYNIITSTCRHYHLLGLARLLAGF